MNGKRSALKKLQERCKRFKLCPFCGAEQGIVKRAGTSMKIVHDKYSKHAELLARGGTYAAMWAKHANEHEE